MADDTGVPTPEERAKEYATEMAEANAGGAGEDKGLDRRDFLGVSLMALGGATVGGFVGFGAGLLGYAVGYNDEDGNVQATTPTTAGPAGPAPDPVTGAVEMLVFYPRAKVGTVSALEEGVPVPFEYPLQGQASELVKLGKPAKFGLGDDADIVAFSTKCTHMGWPLGGTFKKDECIWGPCPGHLSTFDACVGGQNVLGQGTQNLPQIALVIDGDDIYAEGVLGLVYGYRDNLRDGTAVEVSL